MWICMFLISKCIYIWAAEAVDDRDEGGTMEKKVEVFLAKLY